MFIGKFFLWSDCFERTWLWSESVSSALQSDHKWLIRDWSVIILVWKVWSDQNLGPHLNLGIRVICEEKRLKNEWVSRKKEEFTKIFTNFKNFPTGCYYNAASPSRFFTKDALHGANLSTCWCVPDQEEKRFLNFRKLKMFCLSFETCHERD